MDRALLEKVEMIEREIKEIRENMVIKKELSEFRMSVKKELGEIKNRIDEVEESFRRENRRLRDRISDLEHNYEGIAIGAKVGARIGPRPERLYPPMTFAVLSTFDPRYKIATYREKSGLL